MFKIYGIPLKDFLKTALSIYLSRIIVFLMKFKMQLDGASAITFCIDPKKGQDNV